MRASAASTVCLSVWCPIARNRMSVLSDREQGGGVASADRIESAGRQFGVFQTIDRVVHAHVEGIVTAEHDPVGACGFDEVTELQVGVDQGVHMYVAELVARGCT